MPQKINILSPETAAQIAAGEVIERPSSIVRELLDNALDSGARSISIKIEDCGELIITVTDNGEGIPFEELPLAFVKHATSKISSFDEIYHISSLGFRGEALASIASISRVTMMSSTDNSGLGGKIELDGGTVCAHTKVNAPTGTSVTVRSIFYNTPVRKKFLKSTLSEKNDIKQQCVRHMLAHDDVGFTFRVIDKNICREEICIPAGMPLSEKIGFFFGKTIQNDLIPVNADCGNHMTLSGYISGSVYRGRTRKDQYFIVRGRAIQNRDISAALNNAFLKMFPVKFFPFCCLRIVIPSESADINVHPAKKEIRFQDTEKIYSAVYHSVHDALLTYLRSRIISAEAEIGHTGQSEKLETLEKLEKLETFRTSGSSTSFPPEMDHTNPGPLTEERARGGGGEIRPGNSSQENSSQENSSQCKLIKPAHGFIPEINVLGQIDSLYAVYTMGNDLFIADQHAVHERMNLEKIKRQSMTHSLEYQSLLTPVILSFSRMEISLLAQKTEMLKKIGIEPEPLGHDAVQINRIPLYIPSGRESEVIRGILEDALSDKSPDSDSVLENLFASAACRMSIMSGDSLSTHALKELLQEFMQKKHPPFCPHGRPCIKRISQTEIASFFGRKKKDDNFYMMDIKNAETVHS